MCKSWQLDRDTSGLRGSIITSIGLLCQMHALAAVGATPDRAVAGKTLHTVYIGANPTALPADMIPPMDCTVRTVATLN